ncbi:MAG: efflux RND transporter periplasmic adaptor subunit, partial [Acidobacteriota bacterium]|nr:efflux RND transporter periplasmic adaptor subunit [Acidobacteriota bacterium]
MKKLLFIFIIIIGCVVAYRYVTNQADEFSPDITTAAVTVGDIVDAVGATGTLEAVTTVQVGSQVSGIIQELNVDFNSIVREGDVIMRLDPALFETQTAQARANLLRAEADVERLRVTADDAATQLKRSEDLSSRELIAATELEAAQVALRSAEAQIKSAEAQVVQAQATLSQNELTLEHTVIRSPIDGIITSRLVDVGQTVAASLQAPELFVIAADLTKMRVIANIDESDVGRIRPNQRVTFTVDAFPGDDFEGTVSQIRLEPVVQQNVVTYATVIDAPNAELKLKPGMTATVSIEIARRDGVIRIPASALRFRPSAAMFAALKQPLPPSWQETSSRQSQRMLTRNSEEGPSNQSSDPNQAPAEAPEQTAFENGTPSPERRQQMRERLQSMSPEEREA